MLHHIFSKFLRLGLHLTVSSEFLNRFLRSTDWPRSQAGFKNFLTISGRFFDPYFLTRSQSTGLCLPVDFFCSEPIVSVASAVFGCARTGLVAVEVAEVAGLLGPGCGSEGPLNAPGSVRAGASTTGRRGYTAFGSGGPLMWRRASSRWRFLVLGILPVTACSPRNV